MLTAPIAALDRTDALSGPHRFALFLHKWVFKVPRWHSVQDGLRANRRERQFARDHRDCKQLCPVLLADPFGLFLVTPRVRPLELGEAARLGALELVDLFTLPNEFVPGDPSRSRVGVLNGHFVITDCFDQHAQAPQQR